MTIGHKLSVPDDITPCTARIRVIYQNAWKPLSGPNANDIYEGLAIDIPVNIIEDPASITDIGITSPATDCDIIYDLQGRRILHPTSPGIYIINGSKTIIR